MLFKKMSMSLYVSFLVKTVTAALVSTLLFIVLLYLTHGITDLRNTYMQDDLRQQSDIIAQEVISKIETERLSFSQTQEFNFNQVPFYQILFFDEDQLANGADQGLDTQSIFGYEIDFFDTTGKMYISLTGLEANPDALYIVSAVISIVIFILLIIYLIFKEISYIKELEQGINLIATENMLYKIPIKGTNELARLATMINALGDSIYESREKERQDELNQRQLITNMSHDLKTPLTSMKGYIDILSDKLSDQDELYQYALIAKKNGLRLEKLIDDLFYYSKLISHDMPMNLQNLDIPVILNQILEIRTETIVLTTDFDTNKKLIAQIDPEKFHRVMDNLISNAHKYGIQGLPIELTIKNSEDHIVISVENQTNDNLIDKMDKIADRLYSGYEHRPNGSSGLGLSIASELLRAINGTLSLHFKDRTFTAIIKLPII